MPSPVLASRRLSIAAERPLAEITTIWGEPLNMADYLKGLFGGQKPVPSAASDDGMHRSPSNTVTSTDQCDLVQISQILPEHQILHPRQYRQ